jgi:hypothetical protein
VFIPMSGKIFSAVMSATDREGSSTMD